MGKREVDLKRNLSTTSFIPRLRLPFQFPHKQQVTKESDGLENMKITIDINPDNPDGANKIYFDATDNPNFVSMQIDGHYYDVDITELYRTTLPYMDIRHEANRED